MSRDLLHRQEVIRELCPGKTFADVGGLFGTVNEMVTVAMLAGAREATMIDFQPAKNWQWPLFHERCRELGVSGYHSVVGDICNDRLVDDVGRFDVTHCSGVAGDLIVARPGDEVLDDGVAGNHHVAGQAHDVRDPLRTQVDPLDYAVLGPEVTTIIKRLCLAGGHARSIYLDCTFCANMA